MDYNVPLYIDQVRNLWKETKKDFLNLHNWRSFHGPDSEEFYNRTLEWKEFFEVIYDEYLFDDTCFAVKVGSIPAGQIAAGILDLRDRYCYFFEMMHIESKQWLDEEYGALAKEVEELEFWFESIISGITRINGPQPAMIRSTDYPDLIKEIKAAYFDPLTRGYPFIVTWSGGKDSSLVVKAIFEMLESLPEKHRFRQVHIVSSDTMLELPNIKEHLEENVYDMREYAVFKKLPIEVHLLQPPVEQRFFALLVGQGYLAPQKLTRWCTSRLKIRVVEKFINELVKNHEGIVTILGTREDESTSRKKSIEKHSSGDDRYNVRKFKAKTEGHSQEIKQLVYQPIRFFSTAAVWEALESGGFPWGLGYSRLKRIYKDAAGGECPLVLTDETPRACGSRYGCWTCTLIKEDKSLKNIIEKGDSDWLKPLGSFRQYIIDMSKDLSMREKAMYDRRTGKIIKNTSYGGFNILGRRKLFSELMKVNDLINDTKPPGVNFEVISQEEIEQIQKYWMYLDQISLWSEEEALQASLF